MIQLLRSRLMVFFFLSFLFFLLISISLQCKISSLLIQFIFASESSPRISVGSASVPCCCVNRKRE